MVAYNILNGEGQLSLAWKSTCDDRPGTPLPGVSGLFDLPATEKSGSVAPSCLRGPSSLISSTRRLDAPEFAHPLRVRVMRLAPSPSVGSLL